MKQAVTMPALSDTMSNGRLVKWLKQAGDAVKHGEAIAEVETDKAIMEVEAFHDGYLSGPLAATDAEYPVGQAIGYIADTRDEAITGAGSPSEPAVASTPPRVAPAPAPPVFASPAHPVIVPPPPPTRASPYARRLAQQLGVDLAKVGAGSDAVRAADVVNAARPSPIPDLDAGPPYRIERNTSFREAVAHTMIASLATPTFRVTALLPMKKLMGVAKAQSLSLNLLLARAAALTIKEHPLFNAAYTPDGIAHRDRIDIGIAVDSPEGLITPVLHDVTERPIAELAQEWRQLVEKAANRRLTPAEYQGATFYISDLGVFPVVFAFDSIVPLGASALLSVAAARGNSAMCTLNCDHRVVFGGDAARFLQSLEKRLADADKLVS